MINETYPKFKLIRIPGHAHIQGNEFADNTVKQTHPNPYPHHWHTIDIKHFISYHSRSKHKETFQHTSTWHQSLNTNKSYTHKSLNLSADCATRLDTMQFERLRVGYTNNTHKRIIESTLQLPCQLCNSVNLMIPHLLKECRNFQTYRARTFRNENALTLLNNPNIYNINKILTHLKCTVLPLDMHTS